MLPLIRLYQQIENDRPPKPSEVELKEVARKSYDLNPTSLTGNDLYNQHFYPYFKNVTSKYELFIVRNYAQVTFSVCCLITIIFLHPNNTRYEWIFVSSLLIKFSSIMITMQLVAMYRIYAFTIYSHLCHALSCVADIPRESLIILIIIYTTVFENNWVLFQLWLYPSIPIIFAFTHQTLANNYSSIETQINSRLRAHNINNLNVDLNNNKKIATYIYYIIGGLLLLPWKIFHQISNNDFIVVRVIPRTLIETRDWRATYNIRYKFKFKRYAMYYQIWRNICYYLINNVEISYWKNNLYDKCFNQHIGCINYQMLQYLSSVTKPRQSEKKETENDKDQDKDKHKDKHKYKDKKQGKQEEKEKEKEEETHFGYLLRQMKISQNETLFANVTTTMLSFKTENQFQLELEDNKEDDDNDDNTIDGIRDEKENTHKTGSYYIYNNNNFKAIGKLIKGRYNDFCKAYRHTREGGFNPTNDTVFQVYSFFLIANKMNLLIFPFYCWFFTNILDKNDHVTSKHTMFVNLIKLLWVMTLLCFVGLTTMLLKRLIPLYYKLNFVLPREWFDNADLWMRVFVDKDVESESLVDDIIQSIELHYKMLQWRPRLCSILDEMYGNDIGSIIAMYVPIWEDCHGVNKDTKALRLKAKKKQDQQCHDVKGVTLEIDSPTSLSRETETDTETKTSLKVPLLD